MPYKHSQSRSHKFTKPKYKVTNWPEYNEALCRREDFTIWFTEDAITDWRPARTEVHGRPQEYSDHAIKTAILIRQVFHFALRQTEGFINSVARVMGGMPPIERPLYGTWTVKIFVLPGSCHP